MTLSSVLCEPDHCLGEKVIMPLLKVLPPFLVYNSLEYCQRQLAYNTCIRMEFAYRCAFFSSFSKLISKKIFLFALRNYSLFSSNRVKIRRKEKSQPNGCSYSTSKWHAVLNVHYKWVKKKYTQTIWLCCCSLLFQSLFGAIYNRPLKVQMPFLTIS